MVSNSPKCTAITSTRRLRRHGLKFWDGTPVPREDQITYLGGMFIRQVNTRAEMKIRIAATMATWRRMHVFFKNATCPTCWKPIVYNSMICSKILYGLETLAIPQAL